MLNNVIWSYMVTYMVKVKKNLPTISAWISKSDYIKLKAAIESTNLSQSELISNVISKWLRNHQLHTTQPKAEKPVFYPDWICVRGKPRHPNPAMQQAQCDVCKARHFKQWKACQELRAEQQEKASI